MNLPEHITEEDVALVTRVALPTIAAEVLRDAAKSLIEMAEVYEARSEK